MVIPKDMRLSLATARKLLGMSQEDAAKKIGVSQASLSNYERGVSFPDIPVLRRIEAAYGVRYDQIIFLPLDSGLTEAADEKNRQSRKTPKAVNNRERGCKHEADGANDSYADGAGSS